MIFIDEAFPLPVNNLSQLCVILLFLFFVIGLVFSWFRERTAGYIFILWYILEVLAGSLIWDDAGMVLVLGFPLLPMGIFYLLFANRKDRDPPAPAHEQWKLFLRHSILAGAAIHFIIITANFLKLPPLEWLSGPYPYLILVIIIYLLATVFSWWNELITGLLLTGYYIVIIYLLETKIIDEMGPYGLFTFPVLIMGLLYLVYWIYVRPRKAVVNG